MNDRRVEPQLEKQKEAQGTQVPRSQVETRHGRRASHKKEVRQWVRRRRVGMPKPLEQWFSTFLTWRPCNTVPYAVVTPNHIIIFTATSQL